MTPREELENLRRIQELEDKQQAALRKEYDPAAGMGAFERGLVGAGAATRKAYLGLRNLIPGVNLSDDEKDELATYEKNRENLGTAGKVGEFVGEAALTAMPGTGATQLARLGGRVLPRVLGSGPIRNWAGRNIVAPAVGNAAVAAAIDPENRGSAALGGAIGGAAGEVGGRVLGRALGGVTGSTQAARELAAQGIDVPIWKATDQPWLRRLAERAKSHHLTGTLMQGAEERAMRDYNRSLVRGATPPRPVLDEAGNVVRWTRADQAPVRGVGQEGARELGERFDDAYDALYRSRGGIPIDDEFRNAVRAELTAARNYLPRAADDVEGAVRRASDTLTMSPEAAAAQEAAQAAAQGGGHGHGHGHGGGVGDGSARRALDILTRGTETTVERSPILNAQGVPFTNRRLGHEVVTPGNVQQALRELDTSISAAWNRGDSEVAGVLTNIREEIANLRTRGLPPESQSMQRDVNRAYQQYKTLQRAGSTVGAMRREGIVTPMQMTNAIRAADKSPGKKLTFEGRAPGQRNAQLAHEVLGSDLPDSGTAARLLPWLIYGGAAGGYAMGMDPTLALLLGTRGGQRFLSGNYGAQSLVRRAQPSITDWLRTFGAAAGS